MGDDWCRMRIEPGADRNILRELISKQAVSYRDTGNFTRDLIPFLSQRTDEESYQARERFISANGELLEQVIIEENESGYWLCHRMSAIGRHDIFPPDWRFEAYSSFLPEDVPEILNKWRSYINAIRRGEYRDYLLDWYLYSESNRAVEFWEEMQAGVTYSLEHYERYIKSQEVVEKVRELPKPVQYPAPDFESYTSSSQFNWKMDLRYIYLREDFTILHDMRHAWNRNIKKGIKFHRGEHPFGDNEIDPDQFIRYAQSSWIDETLDWVQECVDDGVGLYLWV